MRRVLRDTTDQHAFTRNYADTLSRIFDSWLEASRVRGLSLQSLQARLQEAAEASFAAAYLNGKRQAFPGSGLMQMDKLWIANALQSNQHYLGNSLAGDIGDKLLRQALGPDDPEFVPTLKRAFRSRVENLYGGAIWRVHEAGFLAGVRDLKQALAYRRQQALTQEDDEEEDPSDSWMAKALGLAVPAFLGFLGIRALAGAVGGFTRPPSNEPPIAPQEPRVGIEYVTEGDDKVCDECDAAAGEYWDEDPPLPGDACEGSNNCRCYLQTIVDEAA